MTTKTKAALVVGIVVAAVLVPLCIVAGIVLFDDRNYMLVSVAVAVLSIVPFFVAFEKGGTTVRELVAVAVMTALSVVGRLIFAPLPGFKPVTAIVVITGVAFGAQSGFMCGAMSALVTNIFYGQGPWTPFQMFAWGIVGFCTGLIFFRRQKVGWISLVLVGVVSGCVYSLLMDIWTTLSMTGKFTLQGYIVAVSSSLAVMLEYALSNVLFLLILYKPLDKCLRRVKTKYGLFDCRVTEENSIEQIV